MNNLPGDVQKVVDKYPEIFDVVEDRNRLLCKLTKHEIPMTVKAIESHVQGKKFKRFYQKVQTPAKVFKVDDEYKEFFVPSKKNKNRLYCKLTKKEINNLPYEIEDHIKGYRFLKAKFKWTEAKDADNKDGGVVAELSEQEDDDMDEDLVDDTPDFARSSDEESIPDKKDIDSNTPSVVENVEMDDDDEQIVEVDEKPSKQLKKKNKLKKQQQKDNTETVDEQKTRSRKRKQDIEAENNNKEVKPKKLKKKKPKSKKLTT